MRRKEIVIHFISSIFAYRNSLCGKLHQAVETYKRVRVSTNEQMFDKLILDHRFCDIQILSPETCLIILDGLCIKNHSSHPSISAKVIL